MKIGFVSREYPPFFGGGVGTYVHQVSRALADSGHEVHVFTVKTGNDDAAADSQRVIFHRAQWDPPDPYKTGFFGPWTQASDWLYSARVLSGMLLEHLKTDSLDVVEFPEWEAPGWMLLLDSEWTTPSIVNCHTPTWLLQELNGQPPIKGENLERLEIALADGVCAPCGPMARRIENAVALNRPVEVLHHPYYADHVLNGFSAPFGKEILYVGRLERRKGVIDFVLSAIRVLKNHPDAKFVLVGGDTNTAPAGGPMKGHLVSLIPKEFVPNFRFIDNCRHSKLFEYYKRAAFCVFPSIFENFPNVCLEAMAAGKTAIVGNDSGMVEMIGDSGICVEPENPEMLADKIELLLNNPALCAKLGSNAFKAVRNNFAPALIAQKRVRIYQSVIDSCGGKSLLKNRRESVDQSVWDLALPDLQFIMGAMQGASSTAEATEPDPAIQRIIRRTKTERTPFITALYGAGKHTLRILPHLELLEKNGVRVTMILDDDPAKQGKSLGALPVFSPLDALDSDLDGVVLSSDVAESDLWEKSALLRSAGLPVIRLYDRN